MVEDHYKKRVGCGMSQINVYIKCDCNVEMNREDVYLADIAGVRCADRTVGAKCRALKVHHFSADGPKRCVISVLKLIEMIEEVCPGVNVQSLGEADTLIELVQVKEEKGVKVWIKVFLVCLVSFFGTAFTIMAYHNDVGINEVFQTLYGMVMGQEPEGLNVLEVAYSLGLAAGITLFFNHVGHRRITKDPTPIEVSMKNYETDVNRTLIETASREGKEIDV